MRDAENRFCGCGYECLSPSEPSLRACATVASLVSDSARRIGSSAFSTSRAWSSVADKDEAAAVEGEEAEAEEEDEEEEEDEFALSAEASDALSMTKDEAAAAEAVVSTGAASSCSAVPGSSGTESSKCAHALGGRGDCVEANEACNWCKCGCSDRPLDDDDDDKDDAAADVEQESTASARSKCRVSAALCALSDTTLAADIHAYEYCATLEVRNTSAARSAHGGRPQ